MELRTPKLFWLPKAGNRPEEYEDDSRFDYRLGKDRRPDTATIALSDGASESAFAREWAQILTQAFVEGPFDLSGPTRGALESWLEPCAAKWNKAVPWDRIPWHGEAKTRAGALATLLGLTIGPDGSSGLSWQAAALGDCCLFVVRQDAMLMSFPLEDAGQFNNTPVLICSNPVNNRGLGEGVRRSRGECAPGDLFILASDALACWILDNHSAGGHPWEQLLALDSLERWADWVQTQRRERSLKNDDTTLVIIEVA